MKLLALETATEGCSAALWIDGAVSQRFVVEPRAHARLLLSFAQELLQEAGITPAALDALAFGRGPGSFTGVRIATSFAQGMALGLDLPVLPVSSLAALARAAVSGPEGCVLSAIDARMGEVYWGSFQVRAGRVEALGPEQVLPPAEVPVPEAGDWLGVGTGWGSYAEELAGRTHGRVQRIDDTALPQALAVAQLAVVAFDAGEAVTAAEALPVYLRNRVAHRPAGKP